MKKRVQGAVIALGGPDGYGNTTLARGLMEARSKSSVAFTHHLGKPDPAGAAKLVRLAVRALRKVLRSMPRSFGFPRNNEDYLTFEALLHLMTAMERRHLARRCFTEAASGALVFTDPHPGRVPGSTNGLSIPLTGSPIVRFIGKLERRAHEAIPQPHAVIRLRVPVEETVRRNEARGAEKSEDVIRESHRPENTVEFSSEFQAEIDGMGTPEEVVAAGNSFVDFVLLQLRNRDRRPWPGALTERIPSRHTPIR